MRSVMFTTDVLVAADGTVARMDRLGLELRARSDAHRVAGMVMAADEIAAIVARGRVAFDDDVVLRRAIERCPEIAGEASFEPGCSLDWVGDVEARCARCFTEAAIGAAEHFGTHEVGRCEMHRVEPAEAVRRGQIAGQSHQIVVDLDHGHLRPQHLQPSDCAPKHGRRDPTLSLCRCKRSASLDVSDPDRGQHVGLVPDRSSLRGADFVDQQLDERGRVDVGDH